MRSVGVIEDHPVFREGLSYLVDHDANFSLVGAWPSVEDACRERDVPVVMLVDLHLPGASGPDAVATVAARGSAVLVVSSATTRDDVLDAIAAGACGYLSKDAHPEEVSSAIEVVATGGTYVSATLASYLLGAARASEPVTGSSLTDREKQILVHLAHGERDQDIAEELFISVWTVRSHLDRIREKTGRRRRPDLTRLAIENRLIDP